MMMMMMCVLHWDEKSEVLKILVPANYTIPDTFSSGSFGKSRWYALQFWGYVCIPANNLKHEIDHPQIHQQQAFSMQLTKDRWNKFHNWDNSQSTFQHHTSKKTTQSRESVPAGTVGITRLRCFHAWVPEQQTNNNGPEYMTSFICRYKYINVCCLFGYECGEMRPLCPSQQHWSVWKGNQHTDSPRINQSATSASTF